MLYLKPQEFGLKQLYLNSYSYIVSLENLDWVIKNGVKNSVSIGKNLLFVLPVSGRFVTNEFKIEMFRNDTKENIYIETIKTANKGLYVIAYVYEKDITQHGYTLLVLYNNVLYFKDDIAYKEVLSNDAIFMDTLQTEYNVFVKDRMILSNSNLVVNMNRYRYNYFATCSIIDNFTFVKNVDNQNSVIYNNTDIQSRYGFEKYPYSYNINRQYYNENDDVVMINAKPLSLGGEITRFAEGYEIFVAGLSQSVPVTSHSFITANLPRNYKFFQYDPFNLLGTYITYSYYPQPYKFRIIKTIDRNRVLVQPQFECDIINLERYYNIIHYTPKTFYIGTRFYYSTSVLAEYVTTSIQKVNTIQVDIRNIGEIIDNNIKNLNVYLDINDNKDYLYHSTIPLYEENSLLFDTNRLIDYGLFYQLYTTNNNLGRYWSGSISYLGENFIPVNVVRYDIDNTDGTMQMGFSYKSNYIAAGNIFSFSVYPVLYSTNTIRHYEINEKSRYIFEFDLLYYNPQILNTYSYFNININEYSGSTIVNSYDIFNFKILNDFVTFDAFDTASVKPAAIGHFKVYFDNYDDYVKDIRFCFNVTYSSLYTYSMPIFYMRDLKFYQQSIPGFINRDIRLNLEIPNDIDYLNAGKLNKLKLIIQPINYYNVPLNLNIVYDIIPIETDGNVIANNVYVSDSIYTNKIYGTQSHFTQLYVRDCYITTSYIVNAYITNLYATNSYVRNNHVVSGNILLVGTESYISIRDKANLSVSRNIDIASGTIVIY